MFSFLPLSYYDRRQYGIRTYIGLSRVVNRTWWKDLVGGILLGDFSFFLLLEDGLHARVVQS